MEWLNYHHLLYFWLAAKHGSVTEAAGELRLAQSTVSAQIRRLEHVLDERLFRRDGRRLVLTDVGRTVYRYAEEIFALGGARRRQGPPDRPAAALQRRCRRPDPQARRPPAARARPRARRARARRLPRREDGGAARRTRHPPARRRTDGHAARTDTSVRAYSHLLGDSGVSIYGTAALVRRVRRGFPRSLGGAPLLLPTTNTTLRRSLDQWLAAHDIRPSVAGEFEDSALLKVFGQAGVGLFPAPTVLEREIRRQYGVTVAGHLPDVRERFYAISVERRLKHPAVLAISEAARTNLATPRRAGAWERPHLSGARAPSRP